ncbi:MFS transporter [Allonocardiopsis opalescens]|uniref:MFS transporter n=1 Tax=Allonocardiopsis opalescens TaxID=1144618 RepID=A0A2T0PTR7_9ACTN|nr:MFS transporter [Allonocardiopsis opalescens]PRX92290.1 MFS transporter [Allonocardiopsis opalescens]
MSGAAHEDATDSGDAGTDDGGGDAARRVGAARMIVPLLVAGLTYAIAQTTIVPALPQVQEATGAGPDGAAWVVTGFFVSSAALTVVSGRLGDMFGRRRVLLAVFVLFGVGAVIGATGGSLAAVIAGRVVMGAAGGVFPLSFALLAERLPRPQAALGMGLVSSVFGLGGALGLPVGGLITDQVGYQGLFWLTAAMTVATLAAVAVFVPESPSVSGGRVDWAGAALIMVGLSGVLVAVSRGPVWGWLAWPTLLLGGAGAAALVALLVVEARITDPLLPMPVLGVRNVWVANTAAFMVTFGQATAFFLVPQLVQLPPGGGVGLGADTAQAGLFLLPASLTSMLAGPLTGALVSRWGVRVPLGLGAAATVAGLGLPVAGGFAPVPLLVGSALLGLGGGAAFAVFPLMIADAVPLAVRGAANGVNTIVRHVSMAVAAQVAALVLVTAAPAGASPGAGAFTAAFGIGVAVCAGAVLAAAAVARPDRDSTRARGRVAA